MPKNENQSLPLSTVLTSVSSLAFRFVAARHSGAAVDDNRLLHDQTIVVQLLDIPTRIR